MNFQNAPRTSPSAHIVLIGAGHAHVEVLRRFRAQPRPDIHVTIVSKFPYAAYSGMVPGYVAGYYEASEPFISISRLADFERCDMVIGEAVDFDADARRVTLSNGQQIAGDIVSIDVGAVTDASGAPRIRGLTIPVKPIDLFMQRWPEVLKRLQEHPRSSVAVVGAGAAGVELVLALEHRLAGLRQVGLVDSKSKIFLIERSDEILLGYPMSVRTRLLRILSSRNIAVLTGFAGFDDKSLHCEFDILLWAAGVRPAEWLARSRLAVDRAGFIAVDRYLQSTSHQGVFAAGDAAGMIESPRAKSGVMAVRQGPLLAENLSRAATGSPLLPFSPQATWLSLISAGGRYAVASRGNWSAEGRWVWYWKKWLDTSFVRRYMVW
ncbi:MULTISPECIES: FAD-dependent oxidoreductase [unclassified Afipia]|uniref:FAD-dependent oxidoreductase n=1 Tax=unclassified Afipia TaxID=2642050 RepID=UPI0006855E2E|nr:MULTISPECIES: FAD-dependent oxidoreductase [unclassified Afipia]